VGSSSVLHARGDVRDDARAGELHSFISS